MSKVYCTYFDHRYLTKGLVMISSLRRHVPGAQIWVLCLDARAHGMMEELAEPGVRAIALCDFEAGDAALAKAKADGRSVVEYIFTLTPTLVRYVMRIVPEAEIVTYLDGDLWFLADPEPVYREMGSASVLIIPHGFEPRMKHLERHGIYNVGWVSFRRDSQGTACFEWWRERTNEWCLDQVDAGRFADQGYLDQFPQLFGGVHVLTNHGANLAPWNVAGRRLEVRGDRVLVDGAPLLFFHFHGLKRLGPRRFCAIHWEYRAPMTRLMRDHLYNPYLIDFLAVEQATKHLISEPGEVLRSAHLRRERRPAEGLRALVRSLRARRAGCVLSVPAES